MAFRFLSRLRGVPAKNPCRRPPRMSAVCMHAAFILLPLWSASAQAQTACAPFDPVRNTGFLPTAS